MNVSEQEAVKILQICQTNPVWFTEEIIGAIPWKKQKEILMALIKHNRVAVRSSHGIGKTFTGAMAVLWFLYSFCPSRVITTATTSLQVESILWSEIRKWHRKAKYPLGGIVLNTQIKLDDEWFAIGFSTDKPERFEGHHSENLLFIIDEAKGVPQWLYDSVEGALTTGGNVHILALSTPGDSAGPFYDSFHSKSDKWKTFHISAYEASKYKVFRNGKLVPVISPDWIKDKEDTWGKDSPVFQAKVLGNFPDSSDDQLIKLSWIESARENKITEYISKYNKELGVDVARFGDDDTVFTIRQGPKVLEIESIQGQDTMKIAGRTKHIIQTKNINLTKIDVIGVGAGVVDRLQEQNLEIVPVNVAESPYDKEQFANLRAENYWLLRQRFKDNEIDLSELDEKSYNKLLGQLVSIKYEYTSKGQIKIESKEKMKKRGIKSPDYADSLMLAFSPYNNNEEVGVL